MNTHLKISIYFLFTFLILWLFQFLVETFLFIGNTDWPIYAQAIDRISFEEINPFVPVRQINIFNDHFDPVIIIPAVLSTVLPSPIAIRLFEIAVIFFSGAVFLLPQIRKHFSNQVIVVFVVYFLFNRGITLGLSFPVHPTIWSCLPIVMIALSIVKKSNVSLILSSILLMGCKEEFPFATLFLGLYLLLVNQNKVSGYSITLISLGWLIFIFWGRPIIWPGESIGYAESILERFFESPIAVMLGSFKNKGGQRAIEWLLPLLIIMFPYIPKGKRPIFSTKWIKTYFNHIDYTFIFMLVPILGIRIITGDVRFWEHHYVAPLSALLGGFIITNYNQFHLSKKKIIVFVLVLFLINAEDLFKIPNIKSDVAIRKIPFTQILERTKDLRKAADIASTYKEDEVFTMVNLANLLYKNKYVFYASGFYLNNKNFKGNEFSDYQILLVEKQSLGNTYHKDNYYFEQLIEKWRSEGVVLMETDKLFLARKKRDGALSFLDVSENPQ